MAALAGGESTLTGALYSDDTRYMAESLRRLGISVIEDEANCRFTIQGCGGQLSSSEANLFIGNSGTSVRFLTALCTLGTGNYRVDGIERMRQRPIQDLIEALNQLGANVVSETGTDCPPVSITANGMPGGRCTVRGDISSQYLTSLLMVSPYAQSDVEISVDGDLASKPYIEITLRMMEAWGVQVERDDYERFRIASGQLYRAQKYTIEPDASSASYFFAAAAVTGGRMRIDGLGSNALQGDVGFVDILEQMGCTVDRSESSIEVRGPKRLKGVDVDMNAISDTVMTLAAIAPFADGPTVIRNVANIRVKETDRLAATTTELRRLGVEVEERPDGLTIHPSAKLRPATIHTYDDHRMAMSFAITGLRAPGIQIADPRCVGKTFPGFWDALEKLR
jgi:3-phosphoshikimate 1-carboxyvinyltransferase